MVPSRTNRTNHDPYGWSCPEDITAPLRKGSASATALENQFKRACRRACQIVFDNRPPLLWKDWRSPGYDIMQLSSRLDA